ncbi:MAG: carbon storage regulator [Planctomycetota bacterium]|nr:carbon storage regulator [Planctomycetota bacterium]
MQVITRRVNEGIVVDQNIQVTVVDIQDDRVCLGIICPDDDPPYREETIYVKNASRECEVLMN